MSAIFISHSSKDNKAVEELIKKLNEQGHHSVFVDFDPESGIPAGVNWEQLLYAKLRACQAVIVICSSHSMESKWCFAEITHARSLGKSLFPVLIEPCQTQTVFSDTQITDLSSENGYKRLWMGLKEAGLEDIFVWDGKRPPYPGLSAFQEKDAPLFFGRTEDIRKGIDQLRKLRRSGGERLVLFLGASGSGKSSLVRAGLVPRLKKDEDNWLVINPFRPLGLHGDPFYNLAVVLNSTLGFADTIQNIELIQNQLLEKTRDPHPLLLKAQEFIVKTQKHEATVLIIVDQFEELLGSGFTPLSKTHHFLEWLSEAIIQSQALPNCPLIVLTTMRSDFFIEFQKSVSCELVDFTSYSIKPILKNGLGELIEGPAKLVGLKLAPGLVIKILEEAESQNALPLLAFTMAELWNRYGQDGEITLIDYEELGGVRGSVKKVAEDAFPEGKLSKNQEADLHRAFLAMVQVGEGGQYKSKKVHISEIPTAVLPLMEKLVEARLLVKGEDGDTFEIAHESLFQEWGLFAKWLKEDRSFLDWYQRFKIDLSKWLKLNEDKDALLRGASLVEARRWYKDRSLDIINKEERRFLNRSVSLSRRKTYYALAVGLILMMAMVWQFLINQSPTLYRPMYSVCTANQINTCEKYSLQQTSDPNGYLLGFAEINDEGMPLDEAQHRALIDTLYQAVVEEPAILVVFIHGWRHSAAPGDSSIEQFRQHLLELSSKESKQSQVHQKPRRKIIGIYLGWNGSSRDIFTMMLEDLTFFHRNEVAANIGRGITNLFLNLEDIVNVKNFVSTEKSRLILIGDDLGGNVAFSGLYQILMDRFIGVDPGKSYVSTARGFGDLVLLLNPTIEAIRYFPMFDLLQRRCSYFENQRPKLVILTSKTYNTSRNVSRAGKYFSSLFKPRKIIETNVCKRPIKVDITEADLETVGHYDPFITHTLKLSGNTTNIQAFENINIDHLWSSQVTGGTIQFGGTVLTHLGKTEPRNPYLNIQVDSEVTTKLINDSSGDPFTEFIDALIMLSTEN